MKCCSFIVPCYNESKVISIYYSEMMKVLKTIDNLEYEFIFIDDGSNDNTLCEIKKLREVNDKVHYISFSRNFGKEAAIYSGLEMSKGDYIVTMDVDLQDSPALIPEMYHCIQSGYDCAATRRVTRKGEPVIRSFFARTFYHIINKISKVEIMDGARDYRFMTRQFVEAVLSLKEYNRFLKGIYGWVGFQTKWIEFENVERIAGETKWSFWKLFLYSIEGIVAFSTVPLSLASISGFLCCIISIIAFLFVFIRAILYGDPVSGWPSLVCIITLLGACNC